ncbi:MAG: DUF4831 family protein [Clostridium sp.]|nr:DUF4831 family protein [Clostridium sp.]
MIKQLLRHSAAAAVLLTAAAFGAEAQTTQKFTANKANEYGLVYTLPKTAVEVTVEVERKVSIPGEFFRYSKKYLNLDPIMEQGEEWKIRSVTLSTVGRPDDADEYLVQFKSGATTFMLLDPSGLPLSVNDPDVALPEPPELPEPQEAAPSPLETAAAREAMSEEMLQSKSSAKRAELAAQRIFELRQSRSDIISGQADQMPGDGKAMQLALDNLSAQEAALTAMFAGAVKTSTEVATFVYTPERLSADGDSEQTVLCRLSQAEGLVDSDNLTGAPVYLKLTARRVGELPRNEKGEEKRFPKGGLAYCIPGQAEVAVIYDGRRLASKDFDFAQLGVVFGLDPTLFSDKKAPAYARFDPTTGAVTEIGTAGN